jgi:phage gp36-like protein
MAYSVKADIEKVYPAQDLIDLTDDEGDQSKVTERITQAITDADALMDSYFRAQHTVPIPVVGDEVKNCSVILAYVNLVLRRKTLDDNDGLYKLYKTKIKWLEDVSAGKVHISDPDSFQNLANYIQSNKTSSDKVYTSSKLSQFST